MHIFCRKSFLSLIFATVKYAYCLLRLILCCYFSERINSDFVWYYEGRNGWWQYDDRTASEIETAFRRPDASCEVFIAGHIYVVDFGNMCQVGWQKTYT